MATNVKKDDLTSRLNELFEPKLNEFEKKLNEASKVIAKRSELMFEHHGKLI